MFQKILLSIVLFFAFSIVAFFLLIKVIDFNEYKPRIQKAIKESTGYEVMIRGDITLSLSPAGVSIFDVEILSPSQHQPEVAFAKLGSFDVALDLSALLKKEVKVRHISIDNLTLLVEKNKEGKYNYELPAPKANEKKVKESNATLEMENDFPLVNVKKVKFSNANVTYTDASNNTQIVFEKIDLDINNISFDASKQRLQALFCTMETHIDKIQYGTSYAVRDIAMSLEMKNAIAVSENLRYTLFDTPLVGSAKFDLSGKQPKLSIKSKIVGLKLASLSHELLNQDLFEGSANGDLRLSFFVGDSHTFKSTLNGSVQLYGEDVTLKGYDIDKIALALDPSQRAKGFNFGNLIASATGAFKGGNTLLKEINTKIDLGYSEIKLADVALSSASNRVAMKGAVNIVEEKFIDLGIALLDAKGCPTFEQKTSGSFAKPSIKVDGTAITSLNNVMLSFSTKPKTVSKHNDDNCTIFYEGVIKHPIPVPTTQQGE